MKRLLSLLTAAALAALLCGTAFAAGSAELVRTFVYENTLYTYVDLTGTDQPVTKAEAKVGTRTFPSAGRMETVQQAGAPVTYLLLLDNSTSMPEFRKEVDAFAQALAQTAGQNTRYILATFGDDFVVRSEAVPAEQLAAEIAAVPFDENVTRLHTAIDKALDYLEALPRQGNELRSMLILSDAVQYDPTGGVPYEELLERIDTSDAMLHAIGFGDDAAALASLGQLVTASDGTSWRVGDVSAEAAAQQLVEYTSHLCVVGFALGDGFSGGEESVAITFSSDGELICRAQSSVVIPADDDRQTVEEPESTPPAEPAPDVVPAAPADPAPAVKQEEKGGSGMMIAVIGVVIAVAAIAVVIVVLKNKKSKSVQTDAPENETVSAVFICAEVFDGEAVAEKREYDLLGELFLGRDAACDLVFDDAALSRKHARIFAADGRVYIEDLGSQNGTRVNGASIDVPVNLRSGDEILAGGTKIRLKF